MSAPALLFLFLDAGIKVLRLPPAVDATLQLGSPERLVPVLGGLLLACLALSVLPRTALLGAALLRGHLGGAVAVLSGLSRAARPAGVGRPPPA